MASQEFIQKRLAGKAAELEKLRKKLTRIETAEKGGWKNNNPYFYNEYDLKRCQKDISLAEKQLSDYQTALQQEQEKADSRNVPAILEFLDNWKKRVFEYYDKGLTDAYEELHGVRELGKKIKTFRYGTAEYQKAKDTYTEAHKIYDAKLHGHFRDLTPEEKSNPRFKYTHNVKTKEGEYEYILQYFERTHEEATAKLKEDLTQEANRKYDFIIERVAAIVGTFTDANSLRVGAKGELNGIIQGDRGACSVQTIGAGGWNVQCYHFRTLIHPIELQKEPPPKVSLSEKIHMAESVKSGQIKNSGRTPTHER